MAEATTNPIENGEGAQPGVTVTTPVPQAPNPDDPGMSAALIETEVPGFFTTTYDRDVVKYGWATTPLNLIMRKIGFRHTNSLKYGYWALGLREDTSTLAKDITITEGDSYINSDNEKPEETVIYVPKDHAARFDKAVQIMFPGIDGVNSKGEVVEFMPATALVRKVEYNQEITSGKKGTKLTVQFVGVKAGTTIAAGEDIVVLGHAIEEGDARVTARASNPVPTYQLMQKFMCSAAVTNEYLQAAKEAKYGENDLKEQNNEAFLCEIEKSYIWGRRAILRDIVSGNPTQMAAGLIQQMLEGGSHVVKISLTAFKDKDGNSDEIIMGALAELFVGNTGSATRYLFHGMKFFQNLMSAKDIRRQVNVNETTRKFEYDWAKLRLGPYILLGMVHPLLDKLKKFSNWGIVLDLKYVERRVFRAMTEDQLDLYKLGVSDAKEFRCCEISSLLLKYPECHGLIIFVDDTDDDEATNEAA